jgi:methionyl-tRNA synthetase
MRKEFKRYTVTSALPYTNGPVHIGHIAGAYLPADIYVRYLRSNEKDVIFICGSDEHGVPITIKAQNEHTTPQAIVDKYHAIIKESFKELGISFDIFSRTSNTTHHGTASTFFKILFDNHQFEEKVTEQYFDVEANKYLADRYIIGTCPKCANEKAYGDQCEKCGSTLDPTDLINPVSTITGTKPILKQTKNWYLPLDKWQTRLEAYIGSHPEWKTNVLGQCKSWLNEGLQARAMTRDMEWGVKVPIEGADGKVLYVWFDAPIGYISATKELALQNEKYADWEKYWKDEETRLVHFIGKDNIVFHCIIFPAMLMAHGGYILPDAVPANEFLNLEGDKISTSRNWAIWANEYVKDFPNKQDVLRYVLTSISPETKDSEFTWKDFQARNNNELASILGNFVNRVIVLTHKYFDGIVPNDKGCSDLEETINQFKNNISTSIENFRFREAQAELMNVARLGNKMLTDKEPWKTFKEQPKETGVVLYDCLQIIANFAILCEPFMPFTAEKLKKQLNVTQSVWNWSDIGRQDLVPGGTLLNQPEILFDRIDDAIIDVEIEKLHATKVNNNKDITPSKEEISFDDFSKMDIRTGVILEAKKVEKADKLLELKVDVGFETRTIVSGIAAYFKPEEILQKKVSVLVNLAPRKIRGIESKGMILLAEDKDGKLVFVNAEEEIMNGGLIK